MPFVAINVIPVPTADKAAWLAHGRKTTPVFTDHGALAVTECWGEDVPDGRLTDFKRAVALMDSETVAVAWITWPDRAARDAGWAAMMQDPRMAAMPTPPFDVQRMIYAGFEVAAEG